MDKLIQKLKAEGRIRRQKVGISQVESILKDAILDLNEAKTITHIAERATYMMAYVAMLKAGRALLLLYGYVPDDGAQHKTVVEATSAILGERYKTLTEQFETMRRKRNKMTYGLEILLSKSEVQKAFADAISLVKKILAEIKSKNPQLELDFNGRRSSKN